MPKSSSVPVPGEVLKEKYLEPYQLKAAALAKEIGVYPAIISNVLNSKQRITISLALRLAKYFKTTEKFWVDLQYNYDYEQISKDPALKEALKAIGAAEKPKKGAAPAQKKAAKPARGKTAAKKPAKTSAKKAAKPRAAKPKAENNREGA
jgi:addiction module HigA family antidote